MKRSILSLFLLATLGLTIGAVRDGVLLPGRKADHTLLPNGWRITPAGQHVVTGDLPLRMMLTPDRKHVLVATNGYNEQGLTLLDSATGAVQDRLPLWQSFQGLDAVAASATTATVYIAGGKSGKIHIARAAFSKLAYEGTIDLPAFDTRTGYVTRL